jgi:hypothetical protein
MPLKKQGRKRNPVWFYFIEGPLLNSSHHEAKCKYCYVKMDGVPANMLKHLKECSKISEEICNTLHNLDNNKTQDKNKHKRPHVEIADSNDGI